MADYNYTNFSTDDYDFKSQKGPLPGQKALDFKLTTSTGEKQHLLDFDGDFLVLELGSITCPLFQSRRGIMSHLQEQFPNVSAAILYVREAHPGAHIPAHKSFKDKKACATRLTNDDGENRLVLVDDFEGTAHQAYGSMPNAVFIINKQGCVVYRSDWNNASATRAALKSLIAGEKITAKSYFRPAVPRALAHTFKNAGKGSLSDFLRGLPHLFWTNMIKRNLRLLFGREKFVSAETSC